MAATKEQKRRHQAALRRVLARLRAEQPDTYRRWMAEAIAEDSPDQLPAVRLGKLAPGEHEVALTGGRTFGPGSGVDRVDRWALVTDVQVSTEAGGLVWKVTTVDGEAPLIWTTEDGARYWICARPVSEGAEAR